MVLQLHPEHSCHVAAGLTSRTLDAGHGAAGLPHGAQEQLRAPPHHCTQRSHGQLEV